MSFENQPGEGGAPVETDFNGDRPDAFLEHEGRVGIPHRPIASPRASEKTASCLPPNGVAVKTSAMTKR